MGNLSSYKANSYVMANSLFNQLLILSMEHSVILKCFLAALQNTAYEDRAQADHRRRGK